MVVRHDAHFHWIPFSDLSASELAATRSYLLSRFGKLPAFYKNESSDKTGTASQPLHYPKAEVKPVETGQGRPAQPTVQPNVHEHDKQEHHDTHEVIPTPLNERKGKPNSQIVYSKEELAQAKADGKYVTSDGYIFDAKDIVEDTGDGYVTPHLGHMHWIPKSDLSVVELAQAMAYLNTKATLTETKPDKATDKAPVNSMPRQPQTGVDLYESVTEANVVPADVIPYSLAYTTDYRHGRFIIPHYDHYHYVYANYFTAGAVPVYKASEGYTLEQLFATLKYFINHPDERPRSNAGWGNDSDIYKDSHGSHEHDDDDDHDEETLDEYDLEMTKKAAVYGLDLKAFYEKLGQISKTYRISWDSINYGEQYVQFTGKDGRMITYDLLTEQEVKDDRTTVRLTGPEIYERVKPAKLVPLDMMPYNTAYATNYKDGRIMIPHRNNYRYIQTERFTEGEEPPYSAPQGYSLEDFFATVKYFIEHPDERPTDRPDWGNNSALYKRTLAAEMKKAEESTGTTAETLSEGTTHQPTEVPALTQKTGQEIYAGVAPEKLVPLEVLPYSMAYATDYKDGRLLIPHHNHYHYVQLNHFTRQDEHRYQPPTGYTLEQVFATVKYLIEHPDERPSDKNGWGVASDLYKQQVAKDDTNQTSSVSVSTETESKQQDTLSATPVLEDSHQHDDHEHDDHDDNDEEDDLDVFEEHLKAQAQAFGMDFKVFQRQLTNLAVRHNVTLDRFSYQPDAKTVSFTTSDGAVVTLALLD